MGTEEEKLIQQTTEILKEILLIGKQQLELFKEDNKEKILSLRRSPQWKCYKGLFLFHKTVNAKIVTDPKNFIILLLEEYWKFYETIIEDIKNPIIQFLIRPLLEFTYSRVIWYSCLENEKQKSIAIKYWLYSMGLFCGEKNLITKTINESISYNDLLDELKEEEKNSFKEIQKQNFPNRIINKQLHNLFPKLNKENLPFELKNFTRNICDQLLSLEWLETQYRFFSLFTHVNIFILNNLKKESNTKNHLFRCVVLVAFCGENIIEFTNEKILKDKKIELTSNKTREGIKSLLPKLIKYSNLKDFF